MIHLDTSALVKLVFEEPESGALSSWLEQRHDLPKLSSRITTIELVRTCRRLDDMSEPAARQLLAGLDLVPLTDDVVQSAALVAPSGLRGLDAIHLVSALAFAPVLDWFVAYDQQLLAAARDVGLTVGAPA